MVSRKYKKSVAYNKSRKSRKTIKHLNQVGGGCNNSQPPPPPPLPPPPPPGHNLQVEDDEEDPFEWMETATEEWNLIMIEYVLEIGGQDAALVDMLINYMNEHQKDMGDTLIDASKLGFSLFVETLLQRGANVNAKNDAGETAIWWAAHNGDINVMSGIMNAGEHTQIEIHTKTRGITPMEIATAKLAVAEINKEAQTENAEDTEDYDAVITKYEAVIGMIEEEQGWQHRKIDPDRCGICREKVGDDYQYFCQLCHNYTCFNCVSEICKPRTVDISSIVDGVEVVDTINIDTGKCPWCRTDIPDNICDNISDWLAANPQPTFPDAPLEGTHLGGGGKGTKTRSHRNKKRKSRHSKKRGRKTRSTKK